jgi:L-iditol 2-dehydrogenase
VKAAILYGHEDLRVEEVADPQPAPDEVVVDVEAATTCGTDVKMWRRGHPVLGDYPARFGHEMAGARADTGERVLVGDSLACGACQPCRAGRPQICRDTRWVLGGFAEALAAPEAALHAIPDGLDAAGAAMAEPLAAAVHALDRAPGRELAADAGVLGGGPMGQMLAALLVHEGRTVTLADPHPERREQAEATGAMTAETVRDCDVVFEAVGQPAAWRAAVEACAPGGTVVFVGGCASGSHAPLPTHPLHYDELDLRGAFHHSPAEVDRALALLAEGAVDWRALAAGPIGLDELPSALAERGGPARKWVVNPQRGLTPLTRVEG